MKLNYNASGSARKEFVRILAEIIGAKPEYLRAPTFAFQIGPYKVDREGNLELPAELPPILVRKLMEDLKAKGYEAEMPEELAGEEPPESPTYAIKIPAPDFGETALDNLERMLKAKGALIGKAMGVTELPVEAKDEAVSFPWFDTLPKPEELEAYQAFLERLMALAKKQKRVTAKEKTVENEKYAFRCFLLRLGFIGKEFKEARKILLRNFTGSAAFKSGAPREAE